MQNETGSTHGQPSVAEWRQRSEGLDDSFVMRHTSDHALRRQLQAKYGVSDSCLELQWISGSIDHAERNRGVSRPYSTISHTRSTYDQPSVAEWRQPSEGLDDSFVLRQTSVHALRRQLHAKDGVSDSSRESRWISGSFDHTEGTRRNDNQQGTQNRQQANPLRQNKTKFVCAFCRVPAL